MENTTQPNIKLAVPFFMVRDMEASLNFYIEKLGFTIEMDWRPIEKIEWCWLKRDSVAIMLQQPRKNDHTIYNDEPRGRGISICFQCADALALYHEFTAKDVQIDEPFVGNNLWVVAFNDPDGYRLDFESPTDVPEETKYSEWRKEGK